MKIFTASNIEADSSVEILLNKQELKNLINTLAEFENRIEQFSRKNKDNCNSEFTHLHLKDFGLIGEDSKTDIVFYVDLKK